jgi:hypothetical protein
LIDKLKASDSANVDSKAGTGETNQLKEDVVRLEDVIKGLKEEILELKKHNSVSGVAFIPYAKRLIIWIRTIRSHPLRLTLVSHRGSTPSFRMILPPQEKWVHCIFIISLIISLVYPKGVARPCRTGPSSQ